VEWSGVGGCGGESLKRSPFLLRRSSLASSSGLGGESHASSLAGKKAIKALGAGAGGVCSFLESIITCRKKSIKALGGGAWRASSLAGS
jgi:hypothetical protein